MSTIAILLLPLFVSGRVGSDTTSTTTAITTVQFLLVGVFVVVVEEVSVSKVYAIVVATDHPFSNRPRHSRHRTAWERMQRQGLQCSNFT
jgi:hypothetical protein